MVYKFAAGQIDHADDAGAIRAVLSFLVA